MLSIDLPTEFPFKPPIIIFRSKLRHPNVDGNGNICCDILHDSWSPALTILKCLIVIRDLLMNPNYEEGYWLDLPLKDMYY